MEKSNEDYWREWMTFSSNLYKEKMLGIKGGKPMTPALLEGKVRDEVSPNHWMYKLEPLENPDGKFYYEFLVEYDIYHPSIGIYFGVKLISNPGSDHDENIHTALCQWEELRPTLLQHLNNTFVDIDFFQRFLTTDNANDKTFWPFWISLYPSEDINEVAIRALGIISRIYREFLSGSLTKYSGDERSLKKTNRMVETAFNADALSNLEKSVRNGIGRIGGDTKAKDSAWEKFLELVDTAEKLGVLQRDHAYDIAWRMGEGMTDTDYFCLMQQIFSKVSQTIKVETTSEEISRDKIFIPWKALGRVFLRADGNGFPEQVRTNTPTQKKLKSMKQKFS